MKKSEMINEILQKCNPDFYREWACSELSRWSKNDLEHQLQEAREWKGDEE